MSLDSASFSSRQCLAGVPRRSMYVIIGVSPQQGGLWAIDYIMYSYLAGYCIQRTSRQRDRKVINSNIPTSAMMEWRSVIRRSVYLIIGMHRSLGTNVAGDKSYSQCRLGFGWVVTSHRSAHIIYWLCVCPGNILTRLTLPIATSFYISVLIFTKHVGRYMYTRDTTDVRACSIITEASKWRRNIRETETVAFTAWEDMWTWTWPAWETSSRHTSIQVFMSYLQDRFMAIQAVNVLVLACKCV
jgi:hypothetical protein